MSCPNRRGDEACVFSEGHEAGMCLYPSDYWGDKERATYACLTMECDHEDNAACARAFTERHGLPAR